MFEYKTFHANHPDAIMKKVNKLAQNGGWRLVCTTTLNDFHGVWVHLERSTGIVRERKL